MRAHGINMPDPNPEIQWGDLDQSPAWRPAFQACQQFLPPSNGDSTLSSQELERLRAYAACMRAHSIDLGDPDPTGDMTLHGRLANATRAQVDNDPGYKAATAACQDKLPEEKPGKNK
jgi:hypothetical protein